tara:strand:- start:80 stop:442 length:363 start_codon:yes stop_codon:yes gene_type:complete
MSIDHFKEFNKISKTKDMVTEHLRNNIACREDPMFMYYVVLKDYYQATSPKGRLCKEEEFLSDLYDLLHYTPSAETIFRVKRQIQNTDKNFQASKSTQKKMEERQEVFKDWSTHDRKYKE